MCASIITYFGSCGRTDKFDMLDSDGVESAKKGRGVDSAYKMEKENHLK